MDKQKFKINKTTLGIAGEHYVAAELGRRNVYAQLTLGNQKRIDLLIFAEHTEKVLKIEVKCKQGSMWPNCKGIYQPNTFIVFVDFKDLAPNERPVFYILTVADWRKLIVKKKKHFMAQNPKRKMIIDEYNVLVTLSEINKYGEPYRGCGVVPADLESFKEKWDKILNELKNSK